MSKTKSRNENGGWVDELGAATGRCVAGAPAGLAPNCVVTVAGMRRPSSPEDTPATVQQLATAMTALGMYHGANTREEHDAEAARLGGQDAYRVRMVNALLGVVQTEAMLAETVKLSEDARQAAWEQQLDSAGAGDDPAKRIGFIQWQVLRAGIPLRLIAQNQQVGPIPVAAAHAVDGLQAMLGVISRSQTAVAEGDIDTLTALGPELRKARESLDLAIQNVDILLDMLGSVGL